MNRVGRTGRAAASILATALLVAGLVPGALAVNVEPDKAEVVIVLDFSASILDDDASRNRFGAALERIAARVDETSRDLIGGDTTVSIVQFASRAIDYPNCTNLQLRGSPAAVRVFANCLRSVAGAYRRGIDPALRDAIGIDTNYVAAMEQAAVHLPEESVRPTLILFSDGRHDVAGVPVAEVGPARDRLFGDRSPFALLPVGMGLDPADRDELEAGLLRLQTIRDMPACATGAAFVWPQVVFESPDDAGNAVGVALQNATCTFTVAPTPVPTPSSATAVQGIQLRPLDGRIEVTWSAPTRVTEPITDYRVRCAAEGEEPIESTEGVSLERAAVVEGLTNGTEYRCEVAVVTESSEGEWTASATSATPVEPPSPPGKPTVEPLDGAVRVSVSSNDARASRYQYECSADGGTTWVGDAEVDAAGDTAAQVGGLANGVDHVCRAFALNDSGLSDASPLSDLVRPCGSILECNALAVPILAGIGVLLLAGLLLAFLLLYRDRGGGYTVAVVDVVHTANLGYGSNLRVRFDRAGKGRDVTGISTVRGPGADLRIQKLRGERFSVRDRSGTRVVGSGEQLVVVDSAGARHQLVLWAFEGKAASAVSGRR